MSTVCENSTCTCTKGYSSLGQHCYEGKQFLIKLAAHEWTILEWDDKHETNKLILIFVFK